MARKKLISILISLLVALTFMPVTGQVAFADLQGSFNAAGKVTGLVQSWAEYNSVTISWNAYSGAEGYVVYRAKKKKGKYKKIATVGGCSFRDKGNKKLGKKKYYKVRAYKTVNSVRQYTPYSSILAAKPKVARPTGLSSGGAYSSVTLTWNKVAGASGYQVYRATSAAGKYKKLCTTKKRSYVNKSLSSGTKYYYKVRAYKKKHGKKYGSFTAPIEGMTILPGAGGFSSTLAENGTVTSSWYAVKGASGYQLQRAPAANGNYVTIGETAATRLTDRLTESGDYFYRIRAFAIVNGKKVYGDFSSGGRAGVVNQARSWVGCRESNGSHKKIIDVYNNYGPKYGKIGYGTSWCAAFVSAVAIKTYNTSIIPIDCYCPRMMKNFPNRTGNKSFTPQGGDVIFYDWNANNVPDHVGIIESVSGSNVTAIEGNYSDSVKRRTFKKGYSLILSYCIPNYGVRNIVSYAAPESGEDELIAVASVSEGDILQACEEITAEEPASEPEETVEAAAESDAEAIGEPEVEAMSESEAEVISEPEAEAVPEEAVEEEPVEPVAEPEAEFAAEEAIESEPATEVETAEKIIEYIQEEEPAADEPAEESKYNAFLVYGICDEMDIDACVVTVTENDGTERSYNEVVLDGELYVLNAGEEDGILEKFIPEEIN